jgi:hypothetical protein
VLLTIVVKQLVDYQFNVVTKEVFETRDAISAFQGKFNAATQWLPLVVLAGAAPALRRWGIGVAVLLLPVLMLGDDGRARRRVRPVGGGRGEGRGDEPALLGGARGPRDPVRAGARRDQAEGEGVHRRRRREGRRQGRLGATHHAPAAGASTTGRSRG